MSSGGATRPAWSAPVVWALIAGLVIAAFWPLLSFDPREGLLRATPGLEGVFFDPGGEDPRLIAVLALWMAFNRRGRLAAAWQAGRGRPAIAAALFAGALAIALWSAHTGAPDLLVHTLQLFALAIGALTGGREGMRALRLPVLFLFLAVPVPAVFLNAVLLPLQLATVKVCAAVLNAVGIDAVGVGDQIFTRRGVFHVIETCSGTRLAQTLVMAALVYGELFDRRAARTAQLLLLAPVIAAVVNVARILSIVFNPYSSISSVHTTQGVAMVVIGVLLLAALDRGLDRLWPAPRRDRGPAPNGPPRFAIAPAVAVAVTAVALIAAWVATPRWAPPGEERPIQALARRIDGRTAMTQPTDLAFLGSVRFSDRIELIYTLDDAAEPGRPKDIVLFLGEDDHRNRRGSAISGKTAYPGRAFDRLAATAATFEDGTPVEIGVFRGRDSNQVVLSWREGALSTWLEAARAWSALDRSHLARPRPTRVWRVSTPVANAAEIEPARLELMRFAEAVRSSWRETEPNVRSGG